jgi:hypothetical protein
VVGYVGGGAVTLGCTNVKLFEEGFVVDGTSGAEGGESGLEVVESFSWEVVGFHGFFGFFVGYVGVAFTNVAVYDEEGGGGEGTDTISYEFAHSWTSIVVVTESDGVGVEVGGHPSVGEETDSCLDYTVSLRRDG